MFNEEEMQESGANESLENNETSVETTSVDQGQSAIDDMFGSNAPMAPAAAPAVSWEPDKNTIQSNQPIEIANRPLEAIYDVPVQVTAVLGNATMQVNQVLKLGRGAIVELDKKVGEAIEVYVNNRLVARGEVIIMNEHLGITLTEIIKSDKPQG